jgi:hypothetical protein
MIQPRRDWLIISFRFLKGENILAAFALSCLEIVCEHLAELRHQRFAKRYRIMHDMRGIRADSA